MATWQPALLQQRARPARPLMAATARWWTRTRLAARAAAGMPRKWMPQLCANPRVCPRTPLHAVCPPLPPLLGEVPPVSAQALRLSSEFYILLFRVLKRPPLLECVSPRPSWNSSWNLELVSRLSTARLTSNTYPICSREASRCSSASRLPVISWKVVILGGWCDVSLW